MGGRTHNKRTKLREMQVTNEQTNEKTKMDEW